MNYLVMAVALLTAGCGDPRLPIVDVTGRDQAQVNIDMARCTAESRTKAQWGNGISNCMRAKGYVILINN